MKSYASIDRIVEKFAVCEVELVPAEKSPNLTAFEKETQMLTVRVGLITKVCGNIEEGDIIIVEHDNDEVTQIYGKDEVEKQRRVELLRKILNG